MDYFNRFWSLLRGNKLLISETSDVEVKQKEVEELKGQIQNLKDELSLSQSENSNNLNLFEESNEDERIEGLKKEIDMLSKEKSVLDLKFIRSDAKCKVLIDSNAVSVQQNGFLSIEVFELRERCKRLEIELARNKNVKKLTDERDEAIYSLERMKTRLELTESDLDKERKKNDELISKNEHLTKGLDMIKNNLALERKKADELTNKVDEPARCDQLVANLDKQASAKFNKKQYDEAIELRCKAIGIEEMGSNRKNCLSSLWVGVSESWDKLNRYGKALQASKKAVEFDSSNAVSFYKRAYCYIKTGNHIKAVEDAKKSLKLDASHLYSKDAKALIAKYT